MIIKIRTLTGKETTLHVESEMTILKVKEIICEAEGFIVD